MHSLFVIVLVSCIVLQVCLTHAVETDQNVSSQNYKNTGCPSSFTYVPSVNGCYKVVLTNLDWTFAGLRCKTLNKHAHLLVINSVIEQNAVANMMASYSDTHLQGCWKYGHHLTVPFWTAGQRFNPNANTPFVWRMSDDVCFRADAVSEMLYTKWDNGEPNGGDNNSRRESCMLMCRGANYAWNDELCSIPACSICEIDLHM